MRAQVLEKFNEPYVFKTDHPKPPDPTGPEILVQVQAASYCHTDAVFASGSMWQDLPRVGSHEFSGVISAIGPSVSPSLNLSIGQLVGCPGRAFTPCGHCHECTHNENDPVGYGVWCKRAGNLGLTRDGGFQEYALADSRQVAPVPSGLTAREVAPLMCAGLTIWSALARGGISTTPNGGVGKTVAISGAGGGLGHLGVQFAARLGCTVLAIEAADKQLTLLRKVVSDLGAGGEKIQIIDARTTSATTVRARISNYTTDAVEKDEHGANCLLVLPEQQKALDYGMQLLKDHSTCVIVSFPIDNGFKFNPRDIVFRHINVTGVLVGRNWQLRAMLEFAAKHNVKARSRYYKLEQLNGLVQDYHKNEGGKLVVDFAL